MNNKVRLWEIALRNRASYLRHCGFGADGKQRKLRRSLATLDAVTPMFEDILKIVERVIFDDSDSYLSAAGGPVAGLTRYSASIGPQG